MFISCLYFGIGSGRSACLFPVFILGLVLGGQQ